MSEVPDRAHDPKRRADHVEDVELQDEDALKDSTTTSFAELAEAWSKAYKNHHDTFSWDNPDHYLNKRNY